LGVGDGDGDGVGDGVVDGVGDGIISVLIRRLYMFKTSEVDSLASGN
jgi:hypothetical protein